MSEARGFSSFFGNFLGALTWASVMVTLAYFVGQLVPLETLVTWVGEFAIVALLLGVAAIAIPLWLENRGKKEVETGG